MTLYWVHAVTEATANNRVMNILLCRPGDHDALLASYANNDRQSVNRILNRVEWNQESVESFQSAVHSNTISTLCANISVSRVFLPHLCTNHNSLSTLQNRAASVISEDVLPQAVCPYEPPNRDCSVSGAGKVLPINVYYVFILCVAIIVL